MTLPTGPVTILGIPYVIKECVRPDRDRPDYTFTIDRKQGEIRVLDSVAEDVKRFSIMSAILLEARQLLPPSHAIDEDVDSTMAQALFGSLRTNMGFVDFLTGRVTEPPTDMWLLGARWTVSLVDVIPGQPVQCAGLCQYNQQHIWLREAFPVPYQQHHLLHEWCHAVADLAALKLRDDEGYIRVVAATVYEVFVHNPAFMRELLA